MRAKKQGCIKLLFKSVAEQYQVWKRGSSYLGCVEEYIVENREMANNITLPLILRLLERISSGEGG